MSRGFDGSFVKTQTKYDDYGRVWSTTTPGPDLEGTTGGTSTLFDFLGRPYKVSKALGLIDPSVIPYKWVIADTLITYNGSSITSESTANGVTRTRIEQKNGIGKVSKVTDANGVDVSYAYDAEGNLGHTQDPAGNMLSLQYDARGRKVSSSDPDMHGWYYSYNGFGDLVEQKDPSLRKTQMTYDVLGRITSKTYDAGTDKANRAEWVYDVAGGAGVGKLAAMIGPADQGLKLPCTVPNTTQTSGNRAGRWFAYSPFGEVSEAFECADGDSFSTQYEYDGQGRQKVVRYPEVANSRFGVKYNYTGQGYLHYVSDAADDNVIYWQVKAMDYMGQVTEELTRNGVETSSWRNAATGWLLGQTVTAHADGENVIQDLAYRFDEAGNVLARTRSEPRDMADSTETFTYDKLDRLLTSNVKTEGYDVTENYAYDQLGNLTKKGDKTYVYSGCGSRPHAVCKVGDIRYAYDDSGNAINVQLPAVGTGKVISYNPANKVTRITDRLTHDGTQNIVDFMYGADGNRVVQSVGTDLKSDLARTVYVGLGDTGKSVYERTKRILPGGAASTEHVQFIYAGGAHSGNAFAIRIVTEAPPSDGQSSSTDSGVMKYNHFDHLGSVTAMSDETGRVLGLAYGGPNATVLGYDAWGARRNPDGKAADPRSFPLQAGHREYTGHEAIPNVGLVNMNGRVYDPELGRFLSPDPNVQFVADLQSYNRYSYVRNNPLKYTDPTGYYWADFLQNPSLFWGVATVIGAAVACAGTYGAGCAIFMAWGVFAAVAVQGESFEQAVLSTAVGYAVGNLAGNAASGAEGGWSILGGAVAGGVSASMTRVLLTGQVNGSLGETFLAGAAAGAFSAAVAFGRSQYPVSYASAAEQQGGGGGSGAEQVAAAETAGAASGRPGSLTAADLERIVNGDVVDGSAIPDQSTPRRLTYSVVHPPVWGTVGNLYGDLIQWRLTEPSLLGGWVVQNTRTDYLMIAGTAGGDFAPGGGYSEAWKVNPGQTMTTRSAQYNWDDNTWLAGSGVSSHGTACAIQVARYYEGLSLPSVFKQDNVEPAGHLHATWQNPKLPLSNATPPVIRVECSTW